MNRFPFAGLLLAALLAGCGGQTDPSDTTTTSDGGGDVGRAAQVDTPLQPYCAQAGEAVARQIVSADFQLEGPNAIAGQGDFILANSRALFAITGLGEQKTYYHYPGILVDAVAMADCQQQSQEHFFELPLMIGKLNPFTQSHSTFRAFRADQIQIINDGSNGEAAIVRATGEDSFYWLLELTLMGEAVLDGLPKYLSDPFDLRIE